MRNTEWNIKTEKDLVLLLSMWETYNPGSIDLEMYIYDDHESGKELALSLQSNLQELLQALHDSLKFQSAGHFAAVNHKSKTTLFVVGGNNLVSFADSIHVLMKTNQYCKAIMSSAVSIFEKALAKIQNELSRMYADLRNNNSKSL